VIKSAVFFCQVFSVQEQEHGHRSTVTVGSKLVQTTSPVALDI